LSLSSELVSKLAFKFNLCRYLEGDRGGAPGKDCFVLMPTGGAVYKLNFQFTHKLETARFQPCTYQVKTRFQSLQLQNAT
jgi:hypothetical protein